ncbi:MAG: hypothetical protein JNL08_17910 [Planctomycetes bacterium]|nr:hypothetical protein [Planctomycetota bacterium]
MTTVLLSFLLSTAPLPQQPPNVLEMLSLQHLCGLRHGITPPPFGTMLRWTDGRPDLLHVADADSAIECDNVVQLLNFLHADATGNGILSIQPHGSDLMVLGPTAMVGQVRDEVNQIAQALLRPLTIETAVWSGADLATPPAVLGPGDWRTVFGDREPLWRSTAATQPARAVALDGQRWSRYVADVDTEVAQKQSISPPMTDAFGEGGRVVVLPHALLGGDDFALHVQFGFAQRRGAVRTVPTGVAGQPDLDLPTLETVYGACSARVANGGGLAVTLRGHAAGGGRYVLTVRITSSVPPPSTTLGNFAVLPCSALVSSALQERASPPSPYPDADAGDPLEFSEVGPGFGCIDPGLLQELVRTALGADAENEQTHVQIDSGNLCVIGSEAVRSRVEATLRGLQDRAVRNVTIQHEVRGAGDGAAPLHEVVLPTLLGREATVARLLETRVIDQLWVEIAQEASVYNPAIRTLQSGSWLRCRCAPWGEQQHVQLLTQCVQAPQPQLRSVVPSGGNLMPTEVASARASLDGGVGNGVAVDHGDAPSMMLDGQLLRTRWQTQFRW